MNKLATKGGYMLMPDGLERYNPIASDEVAFAKRAVGSMPLSGFIGGRARGGHYIQRLEELWSDKFRVKHSIACNSATSGILAACVAAGVNGSSTVFTTPYTMSATAAAPKLLGAKVTFGDIEEDTYSLGELDGSCEAVIVTNLFGHPANLAFMRKHTDLFKSVLIEDNAQSILAMENGVYAGTIGHIGVFSLNVHKHIQVGEGGVIVTADDDLAAKMRDFINHGEMMGGSQVGLNLRMTEYTAAMAISQLGRVERLVGSRVEQAEAFIRAVEPFKWVIPPVVRSGCNHVYYVIPFQYRQPEGGPDRDEVVRALKAEGLPLVAGYGEPLYRLKAFRSKHIQGAGLPVVESTNKRLFYFSNCEWSLKERDYSLITEIFEKVGKAYNL